MKKDNFIMTDAEIVELINKCLEYDAKDLTEEQTREILDCLQLLKELIIHNHRHIKKLIDVNIPFKWPIIPISIFHGKFDNLGMDDLYQIRLTDADFMWYRLHVTNLNPHVALILLRTLLELKNYNNNIAVEIEKIYKEMNEHEEALKCMCCKEKPNKN